MRKIAAHLVVAVLYMVVFVFFLPVCVIAGMLLVPFLLVLWWLGPIFDWALKEIRNGKFDKSEFSN